MKSFSKTLRNIFIALMSYSGISALYRMHVKRHGPLVRVVVFHDVKDEVWFRRLITHLDEHYHVLTPAAFLEGRYESDRINILITFDDGYASWVDICAPVLEERDLRGLFFVNSGLVAVHDDSEAQARYVRENLLLSPRKTLSWDGLVQLKEQGHTIGGHGTTHARLAELEREVAECEILDDRETLRTHLGQAPELFAYPFGRRGDYTETTKGLVRQAGYTRAFTTESGFVRRDDVYEIPRLCIENDMTLRRLDLWIMGGYDLYHYIKKLCAR